MSDFMKRVQEAKERAGNTQPTGKAIADYWREQGVGPVSRRERVPNTLGEGPRAIISTYMSQEDRERLIAQAVSEGHSLSSLVRKILREYLENLPT